MLTKKLQRKALSLCKGCTRNSGGKSHNRPKRGKKCTSPGQICVIQTTQQKQTKKTRKRPEPNTNNQPPREKPSMPANSSNQTNSKALTLHHRAENNNDRIKIQSHQPNTILSESVRMPFHLGQGAPQFFCQSRRFILFLLRRETILRERIYWGGPPFGSPNSIYLSNPKTGIKQIEQINDIILRILRNHLESQSWNSFNSFTL